MKIVAIAFVLIATHLVAFMSGRVNVMNNTVVRDIWRGQEPWRGASLNYFGKCAPDDRTCATTPPDPNFP